MHGVPGGLIAGGLFLIPSVLVLTALSRLDAIWKQVPLLAIVLKAAFVALTLVVAL